MLALAFAGTIWSPQPIQSSLALSAPEKAAISKAIGSSRVVMLGELTHGDGTSFEVKSTLVKFLHEELGFDALVWESGLYDCEEMNRELGGKRDIWQTAGLGVFPHWSQSPESIPVFEYARSVAHSKRPLAMAGFDLQTSGRGSDSMLPDFLTWFGEDPSLTPEDRKEIAASFEAVRSAKGQEEFQAAYGRTLATSKLFWNAYSRNRPAWQKAWGPLASFRARALWNADRYAEMMNMAKTGAFSDAFNLRERVNADNLLWLANEKFKGKKLVVWAHNMHVFAGVPGVGAGADVAPVKGRVDSMGRIVKARLGSAVYSVGFIANQGSWSWLGAPANVFGPANPRSWEARLSAFDKPIVFADLRTAAAWAQEPREATIDRQNPLTMQVDWRKGFDAFLFIDKMKARTQR